MGLTGSNATNASLQRCSAFDKPWQLVWRGCEQTQPETCRGFTSVVRSCISAEPNRDKRQICKGVNDSGSLASNRVTLNARFCVLMERNLLAHVDVVALITFARGRFAN
ncbi:hypothetical protein PoB_001990200 [Plakobranchus ocellatus]|uniref:Uncharacterized protein n=1 Tax=Plakobranchus ocellatus TaxID=259542 RepID=A0AAV3ZFT0_9GAST|nr:hypothetical protein PoB_001990200 [Plakobranchus ocellatus]